jgi:hypothetical protein
VPGYEAGVWSGFYQSGPPEAFVELIKKKFRQVGCVSMRSGASSLLRCMSPQGVKFCRFP